MPMSMENGAGLTRSNRTRVPFAVVVKTLGPVAAVNLDCVDSGPTLVEIGFVARVPDHAVVAGLAEDLVIASPPVSVSLPAPPNRKSMPPLPKHCRCPPHQITGPHPQPPTKTSFPAPPNMLARQAIAVGPFRVS